MDRIDILTRACELYLEGGAEAVSMRRLARDLGVTAPALYRHYDSREEMLLDVVAEAYRRLSERLYGALSGRTPAERLYLAGQAYLDFALDQPKYYEMLYTPAHTLGAEEFPEQVTEQVASVGRFFNDRVRECIDAGLFQPLDPADVSRTLWAHAHGLISIYLRGCLHMDAEEFRRHYRASSRRAITGMATPAYEAEMGRAIEDLSRTEAASKAGGRGRLRTGAATGLAWILLSWGGATAAAETAPPAPELLLSIDEVVDLALDRSRELAEARLLLTEAEEQVSEARGEMFPSLDFSASYVRNIAPPVFFMPAMIFNPAARPGEFLPLEFSADNSWQSALTLRQPLFDPRGLFGLAAADNFRRLRTEMVRGHSQQVATRVRLLCYELLLRGEEVRLTERSLERLRQALEETRGRARAGLASDYDVLRLEVELANLEPQLLLARNARESARRRLGLELALDDPGRVRLSEARPSPQRSPVRGCRPGIWCRRRWLTAPTCASSNRPASWAADRCGSSRWSTCPRSPCSPPGTCRRSRTEGSISSAARTTAPPARSPACPWTCPCSPACSGTPASTSGGRPCARRSCGSRWPGTKPRSRSATSRRRWPQPSSARRGSGWPYRRPGGGSRSPAPATARGSAAASR